LRLPAFHHLVVFSAFVIGAAALTAPLPFRLSRVTDLAPGDAARILGAIRSGLASGTPAVLPQVLDRVAGDRVPALLSVWEQGRRRIQWQVDGKPLSESVPELARKVARFAQGRDPGVLRLQLDLAVADGSIPQDGLLASLAFVPGHDGVSGLVGERRVYVTPSELIRQDRYEGVGPLPGWEVGVKLGLGVDKARRALMLEADRLGTGGDEARDLRRFEALTVVEGADLAPRLLMRATVERKVLDRERMKAAVVAGASYLSRALGSSGLYHYHYNPVKDEDVSDPYNWPRHAGVSYSLALVGRLLARPGFVETAGRALDGFVRRLAPGPDGSRCLMDRGTCYVGSSALGLLALSEYRIASGDGRFDGAARGLAKFLLAMQKDDGLFYHDWRPGKGIDRSIMKLYASQQGVLALARHGRAVGDRAAVAAAEKGMDYLAGPYWSFFLGGYFFGQEHWTCLAAEELYDAVRKPKYADICLDVGDHYVRITLGKRDTPFAEDVGGMSVTQLFTPHEGGTATSAEAMTSAVALGERTGRDVSRIKRTVVSTYGFLSRCQVTAHDAFWLKRPEIALGGFYETQVKPQVRIDNVQHAISAMVRGLGYVPAGSASSAAEAERDFSLPPR
jgi:hypothetical protein